MEKEESEEQSKANVTDSADKTEVLCQNKKDILIIHQTEKRFCTDHITNLIKQNKNVAATYNHHNSAINYNYFNYPYPQKIAEKYS